jgi:hypothetical protein
MVANSDGTLAICNMLRDQKVVAWSLTNIATAVAKVKRASAVQQDMYVIVERVIDGVTVYHFEELDFDYLMDSSIKFTSGLPTNTFTIPHLPNTTVSVFADGNLLPDVLTDANGLATLLNPDGSARDVVTEVEFGLSFHSDIQILPLPLEGDFGDGTTFSLLKRINEVNFDLVDTKGLTIDGKRPAFRRFGVSPNSPLDAPTPSITGRKRVEGLLGWSEKAQLDIGQLGSGPLTILAFSMRLAI